jgi:threonyl-tRNA synthetase
MDKKSQHLEKIRHSLAHLLAMAILEKFPKAKLGIGPVIENGFYYDFGNIKLTDADLPTIEKRIRELIKQNLRFKKEIFSSVAAKKTFAKQPYKMELIKELNKDKQKISIYKSGNFTDLCAGPHIKSTKEIDPNAFKLTKIAGAYWKGSEKNPMLARVYGVAFNTKQELDAHLKFLEEAEKRDHRKIGKDLDLFSFHEEGAGFPFWHSKGSVIFNELLKFISKENKKRGYGEVKTPPILNKNLWLTSGHWEKFKESMYFTEIEKQEFAIKPMNCPGALLIFKENLHSYRELPLRFAEFGLVHRHELSGVLHGLFRVRSFTQDDAHVFCAPEQLEKEITNMVEYTMEVYKVFGFDEYEIFIATRPEKHIGSEQAWKTATKALEEALVSKKIKHKTKEGEGAFYGPKIEFNVKDAIARNWQLGTIQVDFSMPERFGATYIDEKGNKKTPVMVHRAILGSFERFIGILIEHFARELPLWLSPVQAEIINVGATHREYANLINQQLTTNNIRAQLSDENLTVSKRIREAEIQKVPYILVVGDREIQNKTVNVRHYRRGQEDEIKLRELIEKIKKEIEDKII